MRSHMNSFASWLLNHELISSSNMAHSGMAGVNRIAEAMQHMRRLLVDNIWKWWWCVDGNVWLCQRGRNRNGCGTICKKRQIFKGEKIFLFAFLVAPSWRCLSLCSREQEITCASLSLSPVAISCATCQQYEWLNTDNAIPIDLLTNVKGNFLLLLASSFFVSFGFYGMSLEAFLVAATHCIDVKSRIICHGSIRPFQLGAAHFDELWGQS